MRNDTITRMRSVNIIEACARAGYESGRSCVLRKGAGKYMKRPWEELPDETRDNFREAVLTIASGNDYFVDEFEDDDMGNELNEIFSSVVKSMIAMLTGLSLARRRQLERTELVKRKVATW